MEIEKLKLQGTMILHLESHNDERGFFMRTYDKKKFENNGIDRDWVQENHSFSSRKGTLRGLHLQLSPYSETKLIRCIKGSIFDVFVDLRKDSKTFGEWDFVEISEENKKMVFIPRGFAHGFCTINDHSEILYKVDNYYSPHHELGIIWNDKDLKIKWPLENPILSQKDRNNITLNDFIHNYGGIKI